ncbi:MAG TPA: hypothetical protein VFE62_03515, partial [Gemmataceae bacterium]|nr:hypothetical protein [Gemmataceae bacterium]
GLTEVNPMRLIDAATGGPIGAVPGSPKFNEILMLYNYRYGGKAGLTLPLFGAGAPAPVGVAQNFLPTPTVIPPPWYSYIDADGLGADPTGKLVGTYPALVGVGTTTSAGGVAVGATSITVAAFSGKSNSGFPWNIMPGVTVVIDTGANAEIVTVATANPASSSFTFSPPLALAHGAGTAVAIGGSYFGFPTFPTGWSNTAATLTGEITNAPLAFNLQKPTLPNIRSTPSQMEAVLRWGATNSPALTSDIFKLMPQCFSDPRFRNKVTTESWSFDRIHASPVIAFDPLNPPVTGNYTLVPPNLYPKLAAAKVTVPATSPSPSGYTAPGPDFTGTVPMAQNNDFIPTDWRSNLGMMLRLNLNRPLTNYPYPPAGGSTVISTAADIATYKVALADRQRFALDIYTALLRVTGAQDPNSLLPAKLATLLPTDPNYMAARWLAQLAVNMVDYIDNDDYVTSWNWNAGAIAGGATNLTSEFVFGTELPRLVLNEIYGQYDDDGMDPSIYSTPQSTKQAAPKASAFNLNVWAELHNPFFSTPAGAVFPYDGGTAMLQNAAGGFPVYRITVCWSNAALSALMRDPANNMGDPGVANTLFTCSDWGSVAGTQQVLPANGAFNSPLNKKAITTASEAGNTVTITTSAAHGFNVGQKVVIAGVANASYNGTYTIATVPSATTFTVNNLTAGLPADSAGGGFAYMGTNNGFYVIGPNATTTSNPLFMPPYDPYIPTTWSSPSMKKTFGITATPQPITVVLQRLAVPHLPPQPNPALALYNPYITVDYMDNIPINDGRVYDGAGVKAPAPNAVTAFTSFGRRQPYAAERTTQVVAQTGTVPPSLAQNSFFQHNVGATTPFDWLVHLDRAPINVTELRHVCAFKPHELTQQFINSAGVKFQHRAAWTDDTAMLYRLYDCFSSANHMAGNIVGGRIPGQININTIMPADGDVFQALCDSQDWNQPPPTFTPMFNSTDVGNIFAKVVGSRHLFGAVAPPINEGNPFRPYSAGSITQTMLRTDPGTGKQLFSVAPGVPNVHPYAHEALLQKIQNNVTTTSNVFAVWWTVGFFEVVDESVRPARLGPEIGRAQNRHIRHRFFALVDRSKMQLFKTTSTTAVTFNAALGMAPQTFTVTVNAPTGAANGVPIGLVPGMLLEIDRGTANAEVVAVTGVPSANSFTAAFTRSHAAGFTILCRGNPGTRAVYNPHDDTTVVLHMSTIK